ncbi:MAG: DUF4351 domain-containing protein [Leptolyngbya sp. SIO4C1]|nr:DUF4351 domain-containing protein [Leptolyngbya sp. SIO4C1]
MRDTPQEWLCHRIESLPLATLENLGKALLDFDGLADLQAWLENIDGSESEEAASDAPGWAGRRFV